MDPNLDDLCKKKISPIEWAKKSKTSLLIQVIAEDVARRINPQVLYYHNDEIQAARKELDFRIPWSGENK